MLEIILVPLLIILTIISLILPWLQRSKIDTLETKIRWLEQKMYRFNSDTNDDNNETSIKKEEHELNTSPEIKEEIKQNKATDEDNIVVVHKKLHVNEKHPTKKSLGIERALGERLMVWLGGIAIALSGFLLVKYSIENAILSPLTRIVLAVFFGIGLIVIGDYLNRKEKVNGNQRISQSLIGSGICVLYGSVYATSFVYELISNLICFLLMGMTTAGAVGLAIIHGPPIAVMALIGGFVTPSILISAPTMTVLFGYMYILYGSTMYLIYRTRWWFLSIPSLIATYCWLAYWLFLSPYTTNLLFFNPFIIFVKVSSILILQVANVTNKNDIITFDWMKIGFKLLTIFLSVVMMSLVTIQSEMALNDLFWYSIISIATIVIAYIDTKTYGFSPWVALIVNIFMLSIWQTNNTNDFILILTLFSVLFFIPSYSIVYFRRRIKPTNWLLVAFASLTSYFLIGYYKLYDIHWLYEYYIWGVIAAMFTIIGVFTLIDTIHKYKDSAYLNHLVSISVIFTTLSLCIGLTVSVNILYLPILIASQLIVVGWLNDLYHFPVFRPIATVLTSLLAVLIFMQFSEEGMNALGMLIYPFKINIFAGLPKVITLPSIYLGIPLSCTLMSHYLFIKQRADNLTNLIEATSIYLFISMAWIYTHYSLNDVDSSIFANPTFTELALFTNIIMITSIGLLQLDQRYHKSHIYQYAALIGCFLSIAKIVLFDMLIKNPLWSSVVISGGPMISLSLAYGIPALCLAILSTQFRNYTFKYASSICNLLIIPMIFVLISLIVRYIFDEPPVINNSIEEIEMYFYSLAWLIFGITLLVLSLTYKNRLMRYGSLSVMILTVIKVFVVDFSALEDLYRVFSFLGLGVTLIGLSYLYTRYVFVGDDRSKK
ncbi:DUF2339 domain-containing protein [Chlamydiia bacterium]|nr:DUF2339 domain-containing protein [Chlamydiia bacterium]